MSRDHLSHTGERTGAGKHAKKCPGCFPPVVELLELSGLCHGKTGIHQEGTMPRASLLLYHISQETACPIMR